VASQTDIFIVDDNQDVLDFLSQLFKYYGYNVKVLDNSTNARDEIRQVNPRLIILDLLMPELDGYSLLQDLRADSSLANIPILIHSGKSYEVDKMKAEKLGASGFIPKPSRAQIILDEVNKHLEV
jgi:two-component system alkaline phosphatase synthesis response regulator PhoP